MFKKTLMSACVCGALTLSSFAQAGDERGQNRDSACRSASLPSYTALTTALKSIVALGAGGNAGLGLHM